MTAHEAKLFLKQNLIYDLTGFAVIVGIKYFNSKAGCSELEWILTPTAWWVRILSGITFEYIPDTGYVNHAFRFIIAPSCSGIQFLMITYATLFFSFLHRMKTGMGKLFWTLGCLPFSFLFTIFINGGRIVLSMYLPLLLKGVIEGGGWISSERLHTATGIVVYFTALLLLYRAVDRAVGDLTASSGPAPTGTCASMIKRWIAPVFWYFFIVLGIPFLNRAYKYNGEQFTEYAVLTCSVCFLLLILWNMIYVILKHHKK